ncbi:lytic polysaccharide monooxygenase [Plenodomus tracheiphilus IPT5]|uniref:Lytic polysaccharide monooxygenase n=1 Tax=Plenodomus tracheiphilus IPT5 TaxID=1408161 RepID=A0A6A7ATU9_9PLEO|nr:lytic polysaccharide monooxygenase [Plenodomus tracheiphilus IPT5]
MFSLVLLLAPLVAAHGHVEKVVADGVTYQGWNAAFKYQSPIPATVGWQADNLDNGFVTPDRFGTVDIVCHKLGKSNGAYVAVKPGSKVTFKWDTWPVSHAGPIQEYIAPCNGDCAAVSPTSLLWTKIQSGAWKSGNNPGAWVTDDLVKNNFSWDLTIPNLAPGKYVIRHEIIALHAAGQANGAQAYPQCVNFEVSGSGTNKLTGGVPATSFYKATDPGILFSLYTAYTGYTTPGPALVKLAKREESREHARDFA